MSPDADFSYTNEGLVKGLATLPYRESLLNQCFAV